MSENDIWSDFNLIKVLRGGGIVVMPTDTIYGLVGRAEDERVVNRIYEIRERNPDKPCIILIGDVNELDKFSVNISDKQKTKLEKYWSHESRAVSIVLDCFDDKFEYLHRGTKTLAFRLPGVLSLRDLLSKTGPLIAPSANTEALPPSRNIEDARKYFGNKVDLYIDGGEVKSKASKVIRLHTDGSALVLRG